MYGVIYLYFSIAELSRRITCTVVHCGDIRLSASGLFIAQCPYYPYPLVLKLLSCAVRYGTVELYKYVPFVCVDYDILLIVKYGTVL